MIAVIDYGLGNVGSIMNMLKKVGAQANIISVPDLLDHADKIILPGVGSFDMGMELLNNRGFTDAIKQNVINRGIPILGICLGMQLLGRKSEEGTGLGLSLIPFDTIRFRLNGENELKVPHMGWNYVTVCNFESPLLRNVGGRQRYYFVHTYHALCDNRSDVLMESDYGYSFTAAVQKDNVYGTQFHPEKSHKFGMQLMTNFVKEC